MPKDTPINEPDQRTFGHFRWSVWYIGQRNKKRRSFVPEGELLTDSLSSQLTDSEAEDIYAVKE